MRPIPALPTVRAVTIPLASARATTPAPTKRRSRDWSGRVVGPEVARALAVFGMLGAHVGASPSTEIHPPNCGGVIDPPPH